MLTLSNVRKHFPDGTQAIVDLTLEIAKGEIVAFIGASGCGKSTLLRLISGLDRASAGTIRLDSQDITAPSPRINLIFQEPRLFPWLDVADNIGFGLKQLDEEARRQRVARVLAGIGLTGFGTRWPKELSGGQAQRVAIGRALVTEPEVLLLDEPFSALDAFTRRDLQDQLLALWQDSRPTMLLVTHDIDEALILADRVIVMRPSPGRILEQIHVPLGRPRDTDAPEFGALRQRVHASLGQSMGDRRPFAA